MTPDGESLLQAWADAAARGRAVAFLRDRLGPPHVGTVERAKDQLDRLAHRQPQQALERARELVEYAESGQDVVARVVAHLAMANALLWCERVREAEQAYEAARRLAEECGQGVLAARCGVGRMGALFRQGRYQEALELADRIEPVLSSHGSTALHAARVQAQRATLLQYLGRVEEALQAYAAASARFRALGSQAALDLAVAQHNAGLLLAQLGRHGEAAPVLREAMACAEATASPLLCARVAAAQAWADLAQGRYAHALRAFEQVASRYQHAGVSPAAAAYRVFALECRLYLGQLERVAQHGVDLAGELDAAGFAAEAARARYLAAVALRHRGDLTGASSLLEAALASLAHVGREAWKAAAACELAAARVRQGNPSAALPLAEQAHGVWERVHSPAGMGRALLVLSDVHAARGETAPAVESAREALRVGLRSQVAWLCAAAHRRLSSLRPQRRTGHLLSGVRWAGRMLAWLPADLRPGVFAEVAELYAGAVLDLWARGRWARAWETAQAAKSRGMAWQLASHGLGLRRPAGQPAEELGRLLEACRRGVFADVDAADLPLAAGTDAPHPEAQVRELLWRLQLDDPAADTSLLWRAARPAFPDLAPDTVLVEYYVAADHLLAFVLRPDRGVWAARTCGAREVARAAALWINGLRAYAVGRLPARQGLEQARTVLQRLYDLLLRPLEPHLKEFRRLLVAPFGLLHGLPFHAFCEGRWYVWDRWEVSYLPAGSLLGLLRRPHTGGGPVVCVADDFGGRLPGAVAEARWVAARTGGQLRQNPTPAEFLQLLGTAGVAHVAAHCRFRPEAPLLSSVHLTHGPVYVADILTSEVRCEVVVLSGCETASSRVLPGDELVGFTRAWFHAGARAVVVSLWAVHDGSAAEFMRQLYAAACAGARLSQALRDAGLRLRREWEHPWHWAGFVVAGDPDARLPAVQPVDAREGEDAGAVEPPERPPAGGLP